jgi:hypothetical protein
MRYWPEISFRCTDHDVSLKQKGKVNLFSEQTDSGGAENVSTIRIYVHLLVKYLLYSVTHMY